MRSKPQNKRLLEHIPQTDSHPKYKQKYKLIRKRQHSRKISRRIWPGTSLNKRRIIQMSNKDEKGYNVIHN